MGLGAAAAVAVGAVALSPALDPGLQARAVLEEQRVAAVERLRAAWSAEGEGGWSSETPTAVFEVGGEEESAVFGEALQLGSDSVVGVLLGEAEWLAATQEDGVEADRALEEARGLAESRRELAAVLAVELKLAGDRRLSSEEQALLAPWSDGAGLSALALSVAREGLATDGAQEREVLGSSFARGMRELGLSLGSGSVALEETPAGLEWRVPAGEDRLRLALERLGSDELREWLRMDLSRRGRESLGVVAELKAPGYQVDLEQGWLAVADRDGDLLKVHVWRLEEGVERLGAYALLGLEHELALVSGPTGAVALRLPGLDLDVHVRPVDPEAALAQAGAGMVARRRGLFALAAAMAGLTGAAFLALRRTRNVAELRADLVANVSHELRTPIAAILMLAENLASGRARERPGQASYPSRIRREAERLRGLVENLLDTSRLERGKALDLQLDVQPVEPWFEAVAKEVGGRVREAGLEFTATGPAAALPGVRHDPEALRRVVLNLAQNALAHAQARRIELTLERVSEREVELCVRDDGQGLSAADRRRVLQPFERGALAERSGTGLGLAICAEIARQHGGRLVLDAGPGECGLLARLALPIESDDDGAAAAAEDREDTA